MKLFKFSNFIFVLVIPALMSAPKIVLAQRALENKYPLINGATIESVSAALPDFIIYIFKMSIAFSGLMVFGMFIYAGVLYYISAGDAAKKQRARKTIKSAFLGLIILLFSWIILSTINPQLIFINMGGLGKIPGEISTNITSTEKTTDIFERNKILAQNIAALPDQIKTTADTIQKLTNKCDCEYTQPLCVCKNYMSGDCGSAYCYAANEKQPCPDGPEIKQNQKKIAELRDKIEYYENRAKDEATDIRNDLDKNVYPLKAWYAQKIAAENEYLKSLAEGGEKEAEAKLISLLNENNDWLKKEIAYKEDLINNLNDIAQAISRIIPAASQLNQLPNFCFSNIDKKCQGSCTGGCHNTTGCFPSKCSGIDSNAPNRIDSNAQNPCPSDSIKYHTEAIAQSPKEIQDIANKIIKIVDSIPKEKIIHTIF